MTVRYSKLWAYLLAGLGIVCVALFFAGAGEAGHWGVVVAGAACLIVGVGYSFRPYLTVEDGRVTVHALLSPAKKTYEFAAGELTLEANRLYIVRGDARERVRISRSLCDAEDWVAFLQRVGLAGETP